MKVLPIEKQINGLNKIKEFVDNNEDKEIIKQCSKTLNDYKNHMSVKNGTFNVLVSMSEKNYNEYIEYLNKQKN